MISAEQFAEWKENPVTKEIFEDLKVIREKHAEQLVLGGTIGHNADITHGMTNKLVGQIEGIDQLLAIHYEVS